MQQRGGPRELYQEPCSEWPGVDQHFSPFVMLQLSNLSREAQKTPGELLRLELQLIRSTAAQEMNAVELYQLCPLWPTSAQLCLAAWHTVQHNVHLTCVWHTDCSPWLRKPLQTEGWGTSLVPVQFPTCSALALRLTGHTALFPSGVPQKELLPSKMENEN